MIINNSNGGNFGVKTTKTIRTTEVLTYSGGIAINKFSGGSGGNGGNRGWLSCPRQELL